MTCICVCIRPVLKHGPRSLTHVRVSKPTCAMEEIIEIVASEADRSIGRGLSMSISVRTLKMVNYAMPEKGEVWGNSDGGS